MPSGLECMPHCGSTRDLRLIYWRRADGRWRPSIGSDGTLEQPIRLYPIVSTRDAGSRAPNGNRIDKDGFRRKFAALDLPADTYTVCATPAEGYLLDSCEWPVPGSATGVKLMDDGT